MKLTPFVSALLAAVYIGTIVLIINTISSIFRFKETILIPLFMLSLFVLSAAVMGFLFFFQPFRLYFDNKKNEALIYFAKTLGIFACMVVLFLLLMLYVGLR